MNGIPSTRETTVQLGKLLQNSATWMRKKKSLKDEDRCPFMTAGVGCIRIDFHN
jgi:hypothetical protein